MTNFTNILTNVPDRLKNLHVDKSPSLLGNVLDFFSDDFNENDISKYDIVFIGIGYNDVEQYLNCIRESFYSLYSHFKGIKILDLGNLLLERNNVNETNKINIILKSVVKHNVLLIPFGKSPTYLNHCYKALSEYDDSISITYISDSASIGNPQENISRKNYLAHILEERNNKLFSLNLIAHQLYKSDPDSLNLLQNYFCQTMRLGSLRNDFKQVEPILRDTDILGINISAVRQCDAPGALISSPNGLYAEEICQLARYTGISDRLLIAGIFGFNIEKDINRATSQLIAQIMWHIIDGYNERKNDNPLKNVNGIKKYIVDMGAPNRQLVFYYSNFSNRWWMEVPLDNNANSLLVACSEDDYRIACNYEVPIRWVWFHQKLSQKNNAV